MTRDDALLASSPNRPGSWRGGFIRLVAGDSTLTPLSALFLACGASSSDLSSANSPFPMPMNLDDRRQWSLHFLMIFDLNENTIQNIERRVRKTLGSNHRSAHILAKKIRKKTASQQRASLIVSEKITDRDHQKVISCLCGQTPWGHENWSFSSTKGYLIDNLWIYFEQHIQTT